MGRLSGKVALITGAAGGLGEDMASVMISEGAIVYITDIDDRKGRDTAARLTAAFICQDVASEQQWIDVLAEIERRSGRLDVLVNNAAIGTAAGAPDPEATVLEAWRKIVTLNGESVFLGCKHAIPLMKASGGGSIINMASIASVAATPMCSAYGFSKGGVLQFTRTVALHCAQQKNNIRCNSVHPGQIETDMLLGIIANFSESSAISFNDARELFLSAIPTGKFQTPRDISNAVLFLASDESSAITGTQIFVDGGMSLVN